MLQKDSTDTLSEVHDQCFHSVPAGALSLMYMPKQLRPAVVYVAHNAHYDACFPIPTPARKHQVGFGPQVL